MRTTRGWWLPLALLAAGCGGTPAAEAPAATPEAGFLEVPARDVTLAGQPASIVATGRLFYNFRPADDGAADRPLFVLFNGYADDIVRPFGTGPMTVAPGGAVVPNPSSLTRFANLLYVEPRQSGYSYDLPGPGGVVGCGADVFNEYVDAADVLLAVLAFLDAHPTLAGPVYWIGESYGGVRVTWILTYLRGRWDLAPYADPVLQTRLAAVKRSSSLRAGQVLLEGWIGGGAERTSTEAACSDPALVAAVATSISASCPDGNACSCADAAGRSIYNFSYTVAQQDQRVLEGDEAHTLPDRAASLLGVPLTSIPLLAAAERSLGGKCSPPDDTVPSQDALVAALGALPAGQAYFVPYSPLLPGKQPSPITDWYTQGYEGLAFADNLRDVPAFLSRGDLDLVVPTTALAPALRALLGADRVDDASPSRLGIIYPDGERFVDVFDYPSAGHMISMMEPGKLAGDLEGWLPASQ